MTTYYVDSNATGTNAGTSWTNAYTSFWSIPSLTLASGDIVYVASNHVEGSVAATKTLTGPTSGAAANVYSVTSGSTTYAAGAQIKTTGGSYALISNGIINWYGITFEAGSNTTSAMQFTGGANTQETVHEDCTYKTGSGGVLYLIGIRRLINPTRDCTNDSSGATNSIWRISTQFRGTEIIGGSTINTTNRTGSSAVFVTNLEDDTQGKIKFSGHDLSSLPSACELINSTGAAAGDIEFHNCKLPSTYTVLSTAIASSMEFQFFNCQNGENDRLGMECYCLGGSVKDSITAGASTVYLTGANGASVDDGNGSTQAFSWVMATSSTAREGCFLYTPWIYFWNDTTGSRNFDLYVGSTETLDDREAFAELEYLGTASSEDFSFATTKPGPTTAAATITTTGGTWNATVTEEYYLRCAVTVNEKGLCRMRVGSAAASKTIYVNPKIIAS